MSMCRLVLGMVPGLMASPILIVFSDASSPSSSGPRTPSPLSDLVILLSPENMSSPDLDTIHEDVSGVKTRSAT
jgi:hypothetical protein